MAAAFTGVQLIFVRLHGLSWDEVVYVSQVSRHAPAAPFDPARSRGIPLLVAPVALITSSVTMLRVYLALASGGALFGALLAWRRLRPTSLLALAGVAFGSLWVAQYYGPQAMPDEWLAFAALAATGLFLRAVGVGEPEETSGWTRVKVVRLIGLAALIAAAALIRPGDAVFLVIVLLAAALAVRSWRRWPVIAAIVIGMAAGSAEWIAEAYARFGGPLARLHLASAEQGGFGLRLGVWAELRAVNGPTLCRPCTIAWRYPVLSLWWLALPVLVVLGILVARRRGGHLAVAIAAAKRPPRRWLRLREGARSGGERSSALLAGVCALALASQYLFGIWYAAPRFLLPAYALAAIPVADLIGWIIARTRPAERPAMRVLVGFVLLLQVVTQHAVLMRQVHDTVALHTDYGTVAADLRQLGIKTPCLINGAQEIPVAFYAGCASAPDPSNSEPANPGRFALLEWQNSKPPAYARNWTQHRLAGTGVLKLIAYLPPGQ